MRPWGRTPAGRRGSDRGKARSEIVLDVSVVIVNWNSGLHLEKLLQSLGETHTAIKETLVVDNASQQFDGRLAEKYPHVTFWRQTRNLGFAAAANRGIERASGSLVLLLNPDVRLLPGSLSGLCEALTKRPKAAIACGPLLGEDGIHQREFQLRPLPHWRNILMDVTFGDELWGDPNRQLPETSAEQGVQVEQPAAAYWLLRREAWADVGGFDPDFFPAWFEDVDFCKRLDARGWQIWFLAGCPARHRGGLALDRLGYRRFVRLYYGNLKKYLSKHHPGWVPWLWLPIQVGIWVRILIISLWRR